ncbi:interferon-induced protein with tetratricopeptide repeats 5-like [Pristis pectinata]|uniref:interferon-induced protein with tetratricopeptide repeats 5-like n=1 Tax=Pristis pectinata TaxID=685728 RepID=UPI00223D8D3E|nr:interferon-induced protein with tetratricopeptide repeats 5-like [Pristis pectinata]
MQKGELSNSLRDLLKEKVKKLQCHFTWGLQKETIDLDEMMYRLQNSVNFGVIYQATFYNQLAFVNCLQGNYEEAIQNLKEAEKILRENHKDEFERRSITYGNFAWVHYHMGQLTEAQSYLDKLEMICKLLTNCPRYTAMIPEVYGEKGWSLLSSAGEYYEEAKECFEKALEEDPDNTEWIMGYATALLCLESFSGTPENYKWSQSVKQLQRVLELDPDDSMAMVLLALKLLEFNEKEEANGLVKEALQKINDLPYMLRYAAKFYRVQGAVENAVKLLKETLELTPHSSFFHHQMAMCYMSKIRDTKKSPISRSHHSMAFQQESELISQCKYHFEKVCEHRVRSAIKSQMHFANFCEIIGDYSKADEVYSNLVKLKDICPENMQKIYLRAGSFELKHKRSKSNAISLFLKGLKVEYDSYERKKCHEELEKWADRKLCRYQHDSKALGVKGLLHQLNGNKSKAIEYFQKALEFDHGNKEYLSALCELCLSMKSQNDA